jgi:hypothetical protein
MKSNKGRTRKRQDRRAISQKRGNTKQHHQSTKHILSTSANTEKVAPDCTYDNCYNTSNHVPTQKVLRLKLHSSFPILFLPEYISRRYASMWTSEASENMCLEKFQWPQDISACYQSFLKESMGQPTDNATIHEPPDGIEPFSQQKKELYETLVRMIVVPLNAGLISKVARPHTRTCYLANREGNEEKESYSSSTCSNAESQEHVQVAPSKVINCYLKTKTKNKRKFNQVNQSLHNLTDGLISTLVHQKKRYSRKRAIKENPEYIHQCRGMNVLSEGYKVATDNHFGPPGKKRRVSKNTNMIGTTTSAVPHCANMQPGIQCTQPNACASFARSSPVMTLLHGLIGDDLMRELLLRCMILVPISNPNGVGFERGNYFQLSGPPLSMMNLNLRPEGFDNATMTNEVGVPSSSKDNKNHSKVDPFFIIPRYRMFYSDTYTPHVGFPPRHILNFGNRPRCSDLENGKSNISVEMNLLSHMVNILKPSGHKVTKRWKRVREGGLDICRRIIKRHNKCDYHRVLERCCPLPDLNKQGNDTMTLELLIARRSDKKKVVSFFKSIITMVFPQDFWGSEHNLNVALEGIETFLTMRKKEQMPMKHIMKGIRILDIHWLFHPSSVESRHKRPRTDHQAGTELMNNVMRWVYCHFLIPLVRSTFYCTNTEFTGDAVCYYRKTVWSKIRGLAMNQLNTQFQPVSTKDIVNTLKESSLACSGLRLLPKQKGIRPIALLCKPERSILASHGVQRSSWESSRSTNQTLGQTFDVLTHEHQQEPQRFGAGMHGLHELHGRLVGYLQTIRDVAPEFYFVSVDIHHCYDNINQQYLFELMKKVVSKEEYAIQEHTVLHPFDNASKVNHKRDKSIGATGDVVNFLEMNKKHAEDHKNAVFVDKVRCNVARKPDLLQLINEHLFRNLLVLRDEFGPQLLIQKTGIPQGSVLSSMLCNYYYGDIEESLLDGVFNEVPRTQHLLVRVIDDFLLITLDKNVAKRFLQNLTSGSESLGVRINEAKTKTSHEFDEHSTLRRPKTSSKRCVVKMNGQNFFPWCGFLFNTQSCEVQIDYERFSQIHASDTLTINRIKNEGTNFISKLRSFVKPRCAPVLFDSRINTLSTLRLNFHQTITMCAVKSYHYISEGLDGGISQNEIFIEESIIRVILFARHLIHSNISKKVRNEGTNADALKLQTLSEPEALFLGIHAFEAVFQHTAKEEFVSMALKLAQHRQNLHLSSDLTAISDAASKALASFDLNRFELLRC